MAILTTIITITLQERQVIMFYQVSTWEEIWLAIMEVMKYYTKSRGEQILFLLLFQSLFTKIFPLLCIAIDQLIKLQLSITEIYK